LLFWYNQKKCTRCHRIFTITDNFMQWGPGGVATCFVQTLIAFQEIRPPYRFDPRSTRRTWDRTFDWVSNHPIPPGLAGSISPGVPLMIRCENGVNEIVI